MAVKQADSEVSLVNIALTELGQAPIVSLDDKTDAARLAKQRYPDTRDAVLREHWWNRATTRVQLPRLAEDPLFGWGAQYAIPNDFIRMWGIETRWVSDYQIEGSKILVDWGGDPVTSDAGALNIVYVFRLTEVVNMDELLKQSIAMKLAATMAIKLTSSVSLKQAMEQLYRAQLAEAQFVDSKENPMDTIDGIAWLAARRSGGLDEPFRRVGGQSTPR